MTSKCLSCNGLKVPSESFNICVNDNITNCSVYLDNNLCKTCDFPFILTIN